MRIIFFLFLFMTTFAKANEPTVYTLHHYDHFETRKAIHFVSVSDRYYNNEEQGVLAISPAYFEDRTGPVDEYIVLSGKYRKRCLKAIGATEDDIVYVYDFAKDKLLRYYVRGLRCVAVINMYTSGAIYPIDQNEYMIGFEIDSPYLSGYQTNTLVAIEKTNPFTRNKVKPVVWSKIDANQFPNKLKYRMKSAHKNRDSTVTFFQFKMEDLTYFIKSSGVGYGVSRHLVVVNTKTNSIVLEQLFEPSEGGSCAPLNNMEAENTDFTCQFAGQLFKNYPPVIFGFMWQSFGCPGINFASPKMKAIYINCDNRH